MESSIQLHRKIYEFYHVKSTSTVFLAAGVHTAAPSILQQTEITDNTE